MIKRQKIIKVGNSLAITLDKDFITKTGLKAGDEVTASYKPEKKVMSVAESQVAYTTDSEVEAYVAGKVTAELEQWTDNFLKENKEAMEKLKDL